MPTVSSANCFFNIAGETRHAEDNVDLDVDAAGFVASSLALGGHGESVFTSATAQVSGLRSTASNGWYVVGSPDLGKGATLLRVGDDASSEACVEAIEDRDRGRAFLGLSSRFVTVGCDTPELPGRGERETDRRDELTALE